MPSVKGAKQDKATIAQLKEEYVQFFADCPIQKYAAAYILRDEQTIMDWKKADPDFRDKIDQAKSKWALKNVLASKAEFQLERMEKELFAERQEITGKDGERLVIPILSNLSALPSDDSNPQGTQTQEAN